MPLLGTNLWERLSRCTSKVSLLSKSGKHFGSYGTSMLGLLSEAGLIISITLEMIPEKMLHTKPIDLRHICLFYLGHMYVQP